MNLSRLKQIIPKPLKRVLRRSLQNVCDSARYRYYLKHYDSRGIRHVIFVCKGNICRSAFAEHYLKRQATFQDVKIESCGLDVDQGIFSPEEAVCVAKKFELDIGFHRSKGLSSCDVHNADLIIPMEFRQYLRLISMFPEKRQNIRLMRDFAPWPERLFCNIDDPYGTDKDEFRRCFSQLQRALEGLKRHLLIDGSLLK